MKHDTALRFWRAYIRMANNGKVQVSMPNPAIAFTARVHAGDFDEIPDDEYEGMSDDTGNLSSFWDGSRQETAEHLIIVIDEADKLFEPAITSGGTDAARMIQNELLKLMDGDTLTFVDSGNSSKKMAVDCRGVSVVLCGSFERMLQAKEEDSGGIGFCQPQRRESRIAECTEEDLIQYGNVRREVAARISRIVTLDAMDAGDFEAVMESPALPIRKIEEAYHVSLDVDADTRRKLASEAAASGLGCRHIRSMLLSMLDVQMFDNPDGKEFSLCLG